MKTEARTLAALVRESNLDSREILAETLEKIAEDWQKTELELSRLDKNINESLNRCVIYFPSCTSIGLIRRDVVLWQHGSPS